MKRIICVLIALLLLTGCAASNPSAASNETSAPTTAVPTTTAPSEPSPASAMLDGVLYQIIPEVTTACAFEDDVVFQDLKPIPACERPDENWECNYEAQELKAVFYH